MLNNHYKIIGLFSIAHSTVYIYLLLCRIVAAIRHIINILSTDDMFEQNTNQI